MANKSSENKKNKKDIKDISKYDEFELSLLNLQVKIILIYMISDLFLASGTFESLNLCCSKKDVDNNLIVFTNTPEPTPVKTGSFMIYIVVIGILSVGLVTYYVIKKQIV